ncbi:MAG TPA: CorA family divalent cation transporter, partial [Clostridia bacterium]|nr:CorA family divalent cation transporter [Clostridia bacterium]
MTGYDIYFIHKAGTIDALNNPADGLAALNSGKPGYLWFDYYRPTQGNLAEAADAFQIHPLSIEDCLDEEQIPKVDEYENYVQILFNKFSY